jgi:hypothetical protein
MHFLITSGTNGGTPDQVANVNRKIEDILKSYPHYKALGNTYIVRINSLVEWNAIHQLIASIAQNAPMALNFVMTPPIQAGVAYNGWMPQPSWDEINKLTQ